MVYTTHYQSPLGALLLAARGDALAGLWLEGQKYFLGSLKEPAEPMEGHPVLLQAGDWLSRYFAGERPDSGELKLDPGGGEFRRTVWEELCRIPYGSVTTYGALARTVAARLGRASMSAQAVGAQPHLEPHPLPPGGGGGRQPYRIRRGNRQEALAFGPRGGGDGPLLRPRQQHRAVREGPMERRRCRWVNLKNPRYIRYHDEEWGRPHYDDGYLFELLVLESFQAGLSWECILNKRESFRTAFDGFDCRKVAAYTQEKMDALAADPSIVRNRRKIAAAVNNARIFLTIQEEFGSFSNYLWHFTRGEQVVHRDGLLRASSPLSDAVSRDLKGRGMRFVGSVIIYSYLQAAGIIDDHEPECDFCCGRQRAKEQPLGIE